MEFRTAPAARGLAWFQGAIRMLDKNPRGLLAVAFLFVLLYQSPNLLRASSALSGMLSVLILLLIPALWGGVIYAIGEADAGRPLSPMQLFEGLRRPGVRAQLMWLGVIVLVALLLVALAFQRILGADNLAILIKVGQQTLSPDSPQVQKLTGPLLRTFMVVLVIGFVLFSGLFFAVPRTLFDGRGAFGAFAESIRACAANVLSMAVYGSVLLVAATVLTVALLIVGVVLGLLGMVGAVLFILAVIATSVVCVVVMTAGNYLAWREVFGHAGPMQQAGIVV